MADWQAQSGCGCRKRETDVNGALHLFVGLIKRTSFTFNEYFRSTLILLVLPPAFTPSFASSLSFYPSPAFYSSPTLLTPPLTADLFPRQTQWYSRETLTSNCTWMSSLVYTYYSSCYTMAHVLSSTGKRTRVVIYLKYILWKAGFTKY